MQCNLPTLTFLVLQLKDPVHSAWKTDIVMELARCRMMHILKQNKKAHSEHKIGKDFPIQGSKSGTECVGSLSLGKEVFQV